MIKAHQKYRKMSILKKINIMTQHIKLFCIVTCLLLLFACSTEEERERPEQPDQVEILPDVIFSVADGEPLYTFLDTRGIVEPIREFTIVPRVSGFVDSHIVVDGNQVREGTTLVQFVDSEASLIVEEAENRYLRAKQEFDIEVRQRTGSTIQSERARSEIADTIRFDDRLVRMQTGYTEAKIALDRARLEHSYTSLITPIQGVIYTEKLLSEGSYISAGTDLGKVVDFSTIRVRFDVLESELIRIRSGMSVTITSADGTILEGNVISISPQVNRDRKTGQVIVEARNPNGVVKPGMSVDGRIFIDSFEGQARFPRAALLSRDDRPVIFKLNGNTVEWIYVEPIATTSDWVVVNHPSINPGDTLAVDRHFAISHLQRVRPTIR